MPEAFRFQRDPELIPPERFERNKQFLGPFGLQGIARLKRGAIIEQANTDAARMLAIWLNAWAPNPGLDRPLFQTAHLCSERPNTSVCKVWKDMVRTRTGDDRRGGRVLVFQKRQA